jgi:hypothetical protein
MMAICTSLTVTAVARQSSSPAASSSPLLLIFTRHAGMTSESTRLLRSYSTMSMPTVIAAFDHAKFMNRDYVSPGKLDLVVTTMNGRIIVLGTDTVFHPLRTWSSEFQGRNGILTLHAKNMFLVAFSFKVSFFQVLLQERVPSESTLLTPRASAAISPAKACRSNSQSKTTREARATRGTLRSEMASRTRLFASPSSLLLFHCVGWLDCC